MIVLKEMNYKPIFETMSLNYDAVDYEDDQLSHTYFQMGCHYRIYVDDVEFDNLQKQCLKLGIKVYTHS